MSTVPENKTVAQVVPPMVHFPTFMHVDYLDAIDAKMALQDPDNAERIQWEQLKGKLGL